MSTNPNIVGGFSPERGFFNQADTGMGGGAGNGKDDDPGVKNPDQEPDQETADKKPDIASSLSVNLDKIGSLIRGKDPKPGQARDLVKESLKLIEDYEPSSEDEKADILFFIDKLILRAKALYSPELNELKTESLRLKSELKASYDGEESTKKSNISSAKPEKKIKESGVEGDEQSEVEQIEDVTQLLMNFDDELKILENQSFVFADDRDWVSESFEEVSSHLATLKGLNNVDKEVIKAKEILLLQLEYKKRREAMFKTLTGKEQEGVLTEGFFARALEGPGLARMSNILARLKLLASREESILYQEDLEKIKKHYLARKWLFFTWLYVAPKIYEGSGSGGEGRTSFGQVSDNQFPLKGEHFQELILGGLDFDSEFGGLLNQKLGTELFSFYKFGDKLDAKEEPDKKNIEVTLFTFCMREFDRIYKEGSDSTDPEDKNQTITKITTQNLVANKDSLIDYVWKKAKKYVKEHGGDQDSQSKIENENSKHAIEMAFRTHLILTMHHCRYASGSPNVKDDWYYAFNWPAYVLSYREKGVDKFDWLVTMLQFGLRPGFNGDQVSDNNLLAQLFDPYTVRKAKRKLEEKGLLNEEDRGLRSLRGLINGYAIGLLDVSPQVTKDVSDSSKKPEYSFLAPPLRYLRQKDKDGKFIAHSAPEGKNGLHVFLDEIRDERGDVLYEEFNYEQLGNELMDYYNNMNAHGIDNFLNKFIKTERFEFMDNATNPKVLKNWKNEARYCATLLPRVGKFALMNIKDSGDPVKLNPDRYPTEDSKRKARESGSPVAEAVMDRILYQIVFINCLLHTDYAVDKKYFWADLELKKYLSNLSAEQILTIEEAKAIFDVVMTYRGRAKMILKGVQDEAFKQIQQANIYK
ncbi:MAG: hypothetical protein GX559_01075 [Candidatus Pacebacteria bacterium]|nr:hypothetical protein [Candidatus Paceibacterota bacterium]